MVTWKTLRKIYTGATMWVFLFPFVMVVEAGLGVQFFNLWIKAQKYSVTLVNTIPTAGYAIQVLSAVFFATIADFTRKRLHVVIAVCILAMVANIMLSVWNIPEGALWFAFFLSNVSPAAHPIVISWGHEITQHNAELRQLLVATGNIFTYICSATLPLGLFPTYDAPHYKYGYKICIMFGALGIIGAYGLHRLHQRQLKTRPTRITDDGRLVVDEREVAT